jgi:hypothetical protein
MVQNDRRHFEGIGCLCVSGAFHPADEAKLVRVDVLARRIDDRLSVDVNQFLKLNCTAAPERIIVWFILHRYCRAINL